MRQARFGFRNRLVASRLPLIAVALFLAGWTVPVRTVATSETDDKKPGEPTAVNFQSNADGTTQRYVELLPKDYKPGETLNLMVALHGSGGDGWEYFQHPAAACRATRDVAAKRRLILVGPDYRGAPSWMGPKADEDVAQIIRELKSRYKIGKVIVVGGSMGGAAALTFTALHPDLVDGVVSQCGLANLAEPCMHRVTIARSFGGTPAEKPEEYKRRSAEFAADKFTMPVAIWTGGKDNSVPPASAIRFAAVLKAKHPDRVLHIHRANSGHSPDYEDTLAAYEFVLSAVLKETGKR